MKYDNTTYVRGEHLLLAGRGGEFCDDLFVCGGGSDRIGATRCARAPDGDARDATIECVLFDFHRVRQTLPHTRRIAQQLGEVGLGFPLFAAHVR